MTRTLCAGRDHGTMTYVKCGRFSWPRGAGIPSGDARAMPILLA